MIVGLALAVGQQLIGVNTVVYYSATILKYTGLSASQSVLQAVTVGITNVVFTVVAIRCSTRSVDALLLLTGTAGARFSPSSGSGCGSSSRPLQAPGSPWGSCSCSWPGSPSGSDRCSGS